MFTKGTLEKVLIVLSIFVFSSVGWAQSPPTYYVDDDFNSSTPGWQVTHFDKIQDAIDKANLSIIQVYAGTYNENIDISYIMVGQTKIRKQISLVSRNGASTTIINGGQNGSTVKFYDAGAGCKIDGFTIRNGTGKSTSWGTCGGGIYCVNCSPLIKNNTIENNTAENGGGVYCEYDVGLSTNACTPTIDSNTIEHNTADDGTQTHGKGGGICCFEIIHQVTIKNNDINNNDSITDGGGIYIRGNAPNAAGNVISLIEHNTNISNNTSGGMGGGIAVEMQGINKIYDNDIKNNSSDLGGGGISVGWKGYNCNDRDLLDRNYLYDNETDGDGGGIYIDQNKAILTNNALNGNSAGSTSGDGGGVYVFGNQATQFTNNSLYDNSASAGTGGGIYLSNGTNINVENTIVWGNTASANGVNELDYGTGAPSVTYCDVENPNNPGNAWPGNTNIWADPKFRDAELHIQNTSPCKNAGNNSANFLPSTDYDGEPRNYNGVDIGSDEIQA